MSHTTIKSSLAQSDNRMAKGFYIILGAQFFSSLVDDSLLFAAIELLKDRAVPS